MLPGLRRLSYAHVLGVLASNLRDCNLCSGDNGHNGRIVAARFGDRHIEMTTMHFRAGLDLGVLFESGAGRQKDGRNRPTDERVFIRAAFGKLHVTGRKKPGQPLAAVPVKSYCNHGFC